MWSNKGASGIRKTLILALVLGTSGASQNALSAKQLYIYPNKGQPEEQQAKDRYECYQWAVKNTGVDPNTLEAPRGLAQVRVAIPENPKQGASAKGTIIGGATGAVIGSLDDGHGRRHHSHTAEGFIIGAIVGSIIGSSVERKGAIDAREAARAEAREKEQKNAEARAQYEKAIDSYGRAFSACMEAREYTVR